MISTYNEISSEHIKLLEIRQTQGLDSVSSNEITSLLSKILEGSSSISDPRKREHLREIARYWATVIYDRTGNYPSTELLPGPLEHQDKSPRNSWRIAAIIFISFVLITIAMLLLNGGDFVPWVPRRPTTTQTHSLLQTSTPALTTQTSTPFLVDTATPIVPSPTISPLTGINIQLTNVQDSDTVYPRMVLKGTFSGLDEQLSSIHILLQPLSTGEGKVYPSEQFFIANGTSGEWGIPIRFGDDESISNVEQYNIRLAFTNSEIARAELLSGLRSGFDLADLPRGLFVLRQVTTVERPAYIHINDNRLLFSSLYSHGDFESSEIVSAPITPSNSGDYVRLTFTTESEIQPSLCPSNQRIVFIQRKWLVEEEKTNWAIWIMDSDGRNMEVLLDEPGVRYERPIWSPNCQYIAYSTFIDDSSIWVLSVLDFNDPAREIYRIGDGRFPSWIPEQSSSNLVFQGTSGIMVSDVATCLENLQSTNDNCFVSPIFDLMIEGTQPSISPDLKWLAIASAPIYEEEHDSYNQDILLFNLQSVGEPIRLTMDPRRDWWPVWGIDSRTLYFESGRTEEYSIWSISIDGTNLQRLTDETRSAQSPDIAFQDAYFPISNDK